MVTSTQMLESLRDYLETKVSTALATAGLTALDKYLDEPPDDDRQKQMAVYLAEGSLKLASSEMIEDAFFVQVQLPGEMRADHYHSAIWPVLKKLSPSLTGHTQKDLSWEVWYPGEFGAGGGGAFLFYELLLQKPIDDCEEDIA